MAEKNEIKTEVKNDKKIIELSKDDINSLIAKWGLQHFEEKTKISGNLIGEKYEEGIKLSFELAWYDYCEYFKDNPMKKIILTTAYMNVEAFKNELLDKFK